MRLVILILLGSSLLFSVLYEDFVAPQVFSNFKIIENKKIFQRDFERNEGESFVIFFPAGEYFLSNIIEIPSRTTIIGAGPSSIIKILSGAQFKIIRSNHIQIKDISFQGDENWKPELFTLNEHGWILDQASRNLEQANYQAALWIDKSTYIDIRNIIFKNLQTGIEIAPIQSYIYSGALKSFGTKFSLITENEINTGVTWDTPKYARIYDLPGLTLSESRFENVRIAMLTRGRNFYLSDNFIFNSIEGITGFNLSFVNLDGNGTHIGIPYPRTQASDELKFTAEGFYLRQQRNFYNNLFYQKRSNALSANNTITYGYYSDIDYLFFRDYRDNLYSDKIISSIIRNTLEGNAGILQGAQVGANSSPNDVYKYIGFSFYNSYIENENGFEIITEFPTSRDSLIFDGVFFNEQAFIYQNKESGLIQRNLFNKRYKNLDLYRPK